MSNMHQGLDLSRFKKVSSDKKSTTLEHSKGHRIIIAHSGLTPKMRERVEALPMAEGGEVEKPEVDDSEVAMDPESPAAVSDAPSTVEDGGNGDMRLALQEANSEAGNNPIKPAAYMPDEPSTDSEPSIPATPTMQQLNGEDAAWAQDLRNGHIAPQTYEGLFAKKDTLGKIGTLFGLLVSGAGSGLAHQPNMVMDMMNRELQNDLQAQIQSKNNANTYMNTATNVMQGMANANNVASHTALNNMRLASYQHLFNMVDKKEPGPYQQSGMQMLQAMFPQIQAANAQSNAKAVLAAHHGNGPTTFNGPVNNEVLSALKVLSPEFGVPAAEEADRVFNTRMQWDAYKDAFSRLDTVTAGETGVNIDLAGKFLEGVTSKIPVASLAGQVAGKAGDIAMKFQQFRNAVRDQVGPDFPESFLPSLYDTPGDRNQKMRSAAIWARQQEGRTSTLDLLNARGMNVTKPSPYDEILAPSSKEDGKPSGNKSRPKKDEVPSSGQYQGLLDALQGKNTKSKVAK